MMPVDYTKARRLLSRRDPVLRDLMRAHGPCGLGARQHVNPFKALIRAIVGQQLSTKAAATIFLRFEGLFEAFPTPSQVLAVPDERPGALPVDVAVLQSDALRGAHTAV